jgi:transposase
MQTPDEVAAMLRLKALGWGIKRIARELGCSHMTVRHYVTQGGWRPYRGRGRPRALAGLEDWLAERFRRHAGNADVVRQELVSEKGIALSLRTVERAVAPLRQELEAQARATLRFETPPGKQLQIDFGERRVAIGGEAVKVYLFVATLGYSRRLYVRAFRNERQESWFAGMEGAFRHFGGVTEEVLFDNDRGLVVRHDRQTREVEFNARLHAFARHWRFRPRACAPYRDPDQRQRRARCRLRQEEHDCRALFCELVGLRGASRPVGTRDCRSESAWHDRRGPDRAL